MVNEELAEKYLVAVKQFIGYGSIDVYTGISRRISAAEEDIAQYFAEHGSIEGLKVAGVGPKSALILDAILRGNIDTVVEQLRDERLKRHQIPERHFRSESAGGWKLERGSKWNQDPSTKSDGVRRF